MKKEGAIKNNTGKVGHVNHMSVIWAPLTRIHCEEIFLPLQNTFSLAYTFSISNFNTTSHCKVQHLLPPRNFSSTKLYTRSTPAQSSSGKPQDRFRQQAAGRAAVWIVWSASVRIARASNTFIKLWKQHAPVSLACKLRAVRARRLISAMPWIP